jgi:hypothetical protein
MESSLQNDEVNEVDQPVILANPPQPDASQHVAERSGLPIPVAGSRRASSISRLIRFSNIRSADSR